MERTAMAELIEKYKALPKSENAWTNRFIEAVINDATELLAKEREQIVEAHMDGDLLIQYPDEARYDAEQYYSSKYEQK